MDGTNKTPSWYSSLARCAHCVTHTLPVKFIIAHAGALLLKG